MPRPVREAGQIDTWDHRSSVKILSPPVEDRLPFRLDPVNESGDSSPGHGVDTERYTAALGKGYDQPNISFIRMSPLHSELRTPREELVVRRHLCQLRAPGDTDLLTEPGIDR